MQAGKIECKGAKRAHFLNIIYGIFLSVISKMRDGQIREGNGCKCCFLKEAQYPASMLMERRVTCSISPGTYSQKLVWYLASIFNSGRRLAHHCTLGILCLKDGR